MHYLHGLRARESCYFVCPKSIFYTCDEFTWYSFIGKVSFTGRPNSAYEDSHYFTYFIKQIGLRQKKYSKVAKNAVLYKDQN